jgi:hypothetical protein
LRTRIAGFWCSLFFDLLFLIPQCMAFRFRATSTKCGLSRRAYRPPDAAAYPGKCRQSAAATVSLRAKVIRWRRPPAVSGWPAPGRSHVIASVISGTRRPENWLFNNFEDGRALCTDLCLLGYQSAAARLRARITRLWPGCPRSLPGDAAIFTTCRSTARVYGTDSAPAASFFVCSGNLRQPGARAAVFTTRPISRARAIYRRSTCSNRAGRRPARWRSKSVTGNGALGAARGVQRVVAAPSGDTSRTWPRSTSRGARHLCPLAGS